jgi:phosphohistidine phosphatase
MDDFDRPLNKRGKHAAPLMGEVMKQRKVDPDVVLSSPSKRTRQTAKLAFESADLEPDIHFEDKIYLASLEQLIRIVCSIDKSADSAMIIGHNPGMSELLHALTGTANEFPTGALAAIELSTHDWSKASQHRGKLSWLITPREIADSE